MWRTAGASRSAKSLAGVAGAAAGQVAYGAHHGVAHGAADRAPGARASHWVGTPWHGRVVELSGCTAIAETAHVPRGRSTLGSELEAFRASQEAPVPPGFKLAPVVMEVQRKYRYPGTIEKRLARDKIPVLDYAQMPGLAGIT